MRLGELLLEAGKISPETLADTLAKQPGAGRRLGELLIDAGHISELDLLEALARQFCFDMLARVPDAELDPELVRDLPVEWARTHHMLPVRHEGRVAVLMEDPTRIDALGDLSLLLDCEPLPLLAPAAEIARCIEQCYYHRGDSSSRFLDTMTADPAAAAQSAARAAGSDDLLRVADQAPVTQLVNLVLLEALKARASDVHVEPFEKHLRIRFRIDGQLYDQSSPPKHLEAALVSRLKVMGKLDIAEKRLPQDGMARVRVGEREVDIRISTIPVAEGERVVLRLLNLDSAQIPLADLGMPATVLEPMRRLLSEPNGIILVTGPTGSGKTTTLYAALREVDTLHKNVLTIEDPIEYQLPRIGQIQVKPKIGLTFANGLRHILRQDPDVILVGEVRDLETAEIMVRSSLTGHLVFSTLHTNDAAGAVLRLCDMGIESYLLASALRAALAQRLVRRLCPLCRSPYTASAEDLAPLGAEARPLVGQTLHAANGCDACLGGYAGRIGIYELLLVDPAMRERIRQGAGPESLKEQAVAAGMPTLLHDGIEKVRAGITTVDEIARALGHAG